MFPLRLHQEFLKLYFYCLPTITLSILNHLVYVAGAEKTISQFLRVTVRLPGRLYIHPSHDTHTTQLPLNLHSPPPRLCTHPPAAKPEVSGGKCGEEMEQLHPTGDGGNASPTSTASFLLGRPFDVTSSSHSVGSHPRHRPARHKRIHAPVPGGFSWRMKSGHKMNGSSRG